MYFLKPLLLRKYSNSGAHKVALAQTKEMLNVCIILDAISEKRPFEFSLQINRNSPVINVRVGHIKGKATEYTKTKEGDKI